LIARVAVFAPVPKPFDYRVPAALQPLTVGARVWAPFGGRALEGVVVALDPKDAHGDAKPLARRVDAPPVATELMALAAWIADYYCAPPGEVLRLMLPAGGKARARRRVSLSALGHQAAAGLEAALEPLALHGLDAEARALLARLRQGSIAEERSRSLEQLVERGLAEIAESLSTRGAPKETILRPARLLDDEARAQAFTRAPRRGEVYARIVAAGAIALSALRHEDVRAPGHARALVDAGLVRPRRASSRPIRSPAADRRRRSCRR
jgi:primosomal protein N' (replication factor Y)